MDIYQYWDKALKNTEIIRSRVKPLSSTDSTQLPYIFLAESAVNRGDTVVRKGEVTVEKPAIILPSHLPQFDGFQNEEGEGLDPNQLINFFLVRGVKFPSMKYNNQTQVLEVSEGKLRQAVERHKHQLEREENTSSGLVVGPEDCWQFSLLIFIMSQVLRQADRDVRELWERLEPEP